MSGTAFFEQAVECGAAAKVYERVEAMVVAQTLVDHASAPVKAALLLPNAPVFGSADATELIAVGPPLIRYDRTEVRLRPRRSFAPEDLAIADITGRGQPMCAGCPRCARLPALLRCLTAGYLLGLTQGAVELAVARARTRLQFGRPIGDNQAVAFPLAALSARLAALRLLGIRVVGDLSEPAPAHLLAVCADLALDATTTAVHLHGAAGLLTENAVQRYYRQAHLIAGRHGTPAQLRRARPHPQEDNDDDRRSTRAVAIHAGTASG